MREALHDGVHEARVAEVLQPLGVVGQRTAGGRGGGAQLWTRGCERCAFLRCVSRPKKGLYQWKIEKQPTLFQIRF